MPSPESERELIRIRSGSLLLQKKKKKKKKKMKHIPSANVMRMRCTFWKSYGTKAKRYCAHVRDHLETQVCSLVHLKQRECYARAKELRAELRRVVRNIADSEVYGGRFAAIIAEVAERFAGDDPAGCAICLDQPCRYVFVPCGHLCVCRDCMVELGFAGGTECPICRTVATSVMRVWS